MNFSVGMDESFLIKVKKRKTESKVDFCIICLTKKLKDKDVMKEPKLSSFKTDFNFLGKTQIWQSCGSGNRL